MATPKKCLEWLPSHMRTHTEVQNEKKAKCYHCSKKPLWFVHERQSPILMKCIFFKYANDMHARVHVSIAHFFQG